MQALEPRMALDRGPALSPRLQAFLDRRKGKTTPAHAETKLEARLARIQENREAKEENRPEKVLPLVQPGKEIRKP